MVNKETIQKVLDNSATPQEAEEVMAYFATKDGRKVLEELVDNELVNLENGTLSLSDSMPSDLIFRMIQKKIRQHRVRRTIFAAAVVLVPLAAVAGALWYVNRNVAADHLFEAVSYDTVTVPNGDKMQVVFHDGSKVYLNSGSSITYPDKFGLRSREVTLEGEAYFTVAPNPRRPFIVHFDCGDVKVLGTSFNLSTYIQDKMVVLALDKGSVEMSFKGTTYDIKPGQVLYYDRKSATAKLTTGGSVQKSRWTDGIITFKSASLDEIATSLGRIFNIEFSISPELDTNVLYTFTSSRADLGQLLEELKLIAPVSIQRDGDIVIVEPNR